MLATFRRAAALCAAPLALAPAAALAAPGDLYVGQAASGSLTGHRLVLRDVAPRVTTFTDRPERLTASLRTAAFVRGWDRAFGDDPPNAALEIAGAPAGRDVAVLELRAPSYDRARRTLSFRVTRLKAADGVLGAFDRRADRAVRGAFGRATLFVDDGATATAARSQLLVTLAAPAGGRAAVRFSNATVALGDGGFGASVTIASSAAPQILLEQHAITSTSTIGDARAFVEAWVATGGPTLDGTASVPSGGTVVVSIGGRDVPLADGPFSIPLS